MDSKRNVLDTAYFFYIFGKVLGISCYSLSKQQRKYQVSFEIKDFFQLISVAAIYVTLIYWNTVFQWKITNDEKNTVIFNSGQQILIVFSLIIVVIVTLQMVWMRKAFWDIANSLNEIDIQVNWDQRPLRFKILQ